MREMNQRGEEVRGVWQGKWQDGWPGPEKEQMLPDPPKRKAIRRTLKRPFIVTLPTQEDSMARYSVGFIDGAGRRLKAYRTHKQVLFPPAGTAEIQEVRA